MTEWTGEKLSRLIASDESETLELKSSFNDEALEAIGAFANMRGGSIIIGVNDAKEISGIQIGKKTLEDIANRIQEATDPRLQPSISAIRSDKKSVVVIQVSPVTGVPASVRGKYFRRTGKTNQRMSHEEIMQRMRASMGLSWDAMPEPSATLDDLDFGRVHRFIQKIQEVGRKPIPEEATGQEFLRKMKLLCDVVPTRAALLLFGKNPESYFSSAFLKLGRFRSPTHIVDDREVHGALIDQLDEAMAWFRERLETEFIITGKPEREVKWEYPLKAIREAVTNALCHRDYTSLAHSQIRLYDDHLEIWNAGGLPPALTPEALFQEHDSIPRNRMIAEMFFYAGLIERWGSGTLRIAEELQTVGLPAPQFTSEPDRFRISLYKSVFAEEHLKKLGLSERQLKAVAYVKDHGRISNAEYRTISGISDRTALRELNELKNKGILVRDAATGRGTAYRLKPAINPPNTPRTHPKSAKDAK